jgi:putative addiction module component (TIGR02574 family)
MTDTHIAEILELSVEDRLRLVELIWESIATDPSALPLSDAHIAVLEERLAEDQRDPSNVLTLEEVLSEVRRVS